MSIVAEPIMKVYLILLLKWCLFINPTQSQWYFPHQFNQIQPAFYSQPILAPPPATITYNLPPTTTRNNIEQQQAAEYRGFSYHTNYQDGASSTVFFVTGPEAQQLRTFEDFPNFQRQSINPTNKARSLASNILDGNAIQDVSKQIQDTLLKPSDFQLLFDNRSPGITHFYRFPAGTVPLVQQPIINNKNETTTTETNTATTTITPITTTNNDDSEEIVAEEVAESVIKDSRILINTIDDNAEKIKSLEGIESTITTTRTEITSETDSSEKSNVATTTTETTENNSSATTTTATVDALLLDNSNADTNTESTDKIETTTV